MLDDSRVIEKRDSEQVFKAIASQYQQALMELEVLQPEHDSRKVASIVFVGMGGSALAAMLAETWLSEKLTVPFMVVREYVLPAFIGPSTLVIASSCSGNTEEVLEALSQAEEAGAQTAVIAGGGRMSERAKLGGMCHIDIPNYGAQPRFLTIIQLRAIVTMLAHFGCISGVELREIAQSANWLKAAITRWGVAVPVHENEAKQLALLAVGKTPIVYAGPLMRSAAYKWKISWNENAKNVAFWNEYPESSHNDFMGWTSHPIEKPFIIFDLVSSREHSQVLRRFDLSDRLLSGKRPKAHQIEVKGKTVLQQLLWAYALGDFVSCYVAILNNVDPGPVPLISRLKEELTKN